MPRARISDEMAESMACLYDEGCTIDEITRRFPYSFGGVRRALLRCGVTLRARGPKGGKDED